MSLSDQMKTLNYMNKILSGERNGLTQNAFYPQKKTFEYRANTPLPRATPEEHGVSDKQILHFYETLATNERLSAHSAIVIKNGEVIAEAGFTPYDLNTWHITHSLSKTVVALAVGIAVDEGIFKETDLLVDLLSDDIPFLVSQNMKAVTIHHLLSMTTNVSFKEFGAITSNNWLRDFLRADFKAKPGADFDYNSMNTYILGVVISKLTGMSLTEYLKPRLFEPLGMNNYFWEKTVDGQEKAGWGMYILLEEIAKVGLLILNEGTFTLNGKTKQVVSGEWIKKMTTNHLSQFPLHAGYGYQLWLDRDLRYYNMAGLFGQMVWICPEENIVVALFSGNQSIHSSGTIKQLLVESFLDVDETILNKIEPNQLKTKLSQLTYRNLSFKSPDLVEEKPSFFNKMKSFFTGKEEEIKKQLQFPENFLQYLNQTFEMNDNKVGIFPFSMQAMTNNYFEGVKHLTFKKIDETLYLLWVEKNGHYQIPIGFEMPLHSAISFGKETHKIASYGAMAKDEDEQDVLKLTVFFLETSSIRYVKIFFLDEGEVLIKFDETPSFYEMMKSATHGIENNAIVKSVLSDPDYLEFMIKRLATPEIKGHRRKGIVEKEKN